MSLSARERLIVALDTPGLEEAEALASALAGEAGLLKVGLELFVSAGPEAVRRLRDAGYGIFLDLKLHDIPNTVGAAARAAGRLGVRIMTVHASGGPAMIAAAAEGARAGAADAGVAPPIVLAVTVLTSLRDADLAAVGLAGPSAEAVVRLARMATGSGADGVVCSPEEAAAVRAALGPDRVVVTPGIRPAGAALGDQARVATPAAAIRAGADYLVVGRPIREAADPAEAARRIVAEVGAA